MNNNSLWNKLVDDKQCREYCEKCAFNAGKGRCAALKDSTRDYKCKICNIHHCFKTLNNDNICLTCAS